MLYPFGLALLIIPKSFQNVKRFKTFLQSVFCFAGATGKRQLYVAIKTYANCEIVFFSQNQCYRSNLRSICLSFFNFRSRSRLLLYNNTLLNICQYLCLKNPKRFSALSSIYNAFIRFRFRGRHLCLHVFIDLLRRSLETAYLLYGENETLSSMISHNYNSLFPDMELCF